MAHDDRKQIPEEELPDTHNASHGYREGGEPTIAETQEGARGTPDAEDDRAAHVPIEQIRPPILDPIEAAGVNRRDQPKP